MQASAASYLDGFDKHNQVILEGAADKIQQALIALGVEIVALAVALGGTSETRSASIGAGL